MSTESFHADPERGPSAKAKPPKPRADAKALRRELDALVLKQIECEETLKISVGQLAERVARLEWMLDWVRPRNLRVVLEPPEPRTGRRRP